MRAVWHWHGPSQRCQQAKSEECHRHHRQEPAACAACDLEVSSRIGRTTRARLTVAAERVPAGASVDLSLLGAEIRTGGRYRPRPTESSRLSVDELTALLFATSIRRSSRRTFNPTRDGGRWSASALRGVRSFGREL